MRQAQQAAGGWELRFGAHPRHTGFRAGGPGARPPPGARVSDELTMMERLAHGTAMTVSMRELVHRLTAAVRVCPSGPTSMLPKCPGPAFHLLHPSTETT